MNSAIYELTLLMPFDVPQVRFSTVIKAMSTSFRTCHFGRFASLIHASSRAGSRSATARKISRRHRLVSVFLQTFFFPSPCALTLLQLWLDCMDQEEQSPWLHRGKLCPPVFYLFLYTDSLPKFFYKLFFKSECFFFWQKSPQESSVVNWDSFKWH